MAIFGYDPIAGRKLSPTERLTRGLGPALKGLGHAKLPRMKGGGGALGKFKKGIEAEKNFIVAAREGGCFVAGTPVTLGNGHVVPIESVKKGDAVLSRDPANGKIEAKVVESVSKTTTHQLVTAELADPKSGKIVETLTGTPNHPIYMEGRGWVALGELGIGTSVVTHDGLLGGLRSLLWSRATPGGDRSPQD